MPGLLDIGQRQRGVGFKRLGLELYRLPQRRFCFRELTEFQECQPSVVLRLKECRVAIGSDPERLQSFVFEAGVSQKNSEREQDVGVRMRIAGEIPIDPDGQLLFALIQMLRKCQQLFDRLPVASLVGMIYVLASFAIVLRGLPYLWYDVVGPALGFWRGMFVPAVLLAALMLAAVVGLVVLGVRLLVGRPGAPATG